MTLSATFATKLARFRAAKPPCKGNKRMSNSYRRQVAKKLMKEIETTKDPKVLADLANVLAKFLPKTKQTRRPRNTPTQPEPEEVSIDKLVAAMEKKRREQAATDRADHKTNGKEVS